MSNLLEDEAVTYSKYFANKTISIRIGKEELDKRLVNIINKKDKVAFLYVLRKETHKRCKEHEGCTNPTCKMDKNYQTALFVIDQELEYLESALSKEQEPKDKISIEERVELKNKISQVLDELNKLGMGQQIVFEEIESLKEHFELGKKDWTQLLKGKLMDFVLQGLIEKAAVPMIYQAIVGSVEAGFFVLSK